MKVKHEIIFDQKSKKEKKLVQAPRPETKAQGSRLKAQGSRLKVLCEAQPVW
jgi:hypothetical protein